MTMYETSKSPAVMDDATPCLKSKMAGNKPEAVISETMKYIIKIPTANLRYSTVANSQEV